MSVIVYTKPACVQCMATYRALDKLDIDYTVVDLSEDPTALQEVQDLGYFAAPVVVTATDHWSGFRPDKIAQIAAAPARQSAGAIHVA